MNRQLCFIVFTVFSGRMMLEVRECWWTSGVPSSKPDWSALYLDLTESTHTLTNWVRYTQTFLNKAYVPEHMQQRATDMHTDYLHTLVLFHKQKAYKHTFPHYSVCNTHTGWHCFFIYNRGYFSAADQGWEEPRCLCDLQLYQVNNHEASYSVYIQYTMTSLLSVATSAPEHAHQWCWVFSLVCYSSDDGLIVWFHWLTTNEIVVAVRLYDHHWCT